MSRKYICIIPARFGSKRLPDKNILPLNGKPLIAYTIEQAKESAGFEAIAVSSDSDEILNTAKATGADLLLKRPAELASDKASSLEVIKHTVKAAEGKTGDDYDSIVLLQVTSPLRLPADIKKAIAIFEEKPAGSLISVAETDPSFKSKNNLSKVPGQEKYHINGSIYIWDKQSFLTEPKHLYADSRLMLMPTHRSIDIDEQADFDFAESLLQSGEYKRGESIAINY